MEGSAAVQPGSDVQTAAVQKRQFQNQTAGWIGVVILNGRGDEIGVAVEPNGAVWLSEAEVILTARAPRRAEDNPFEEQVFVTVDPQTGRRVDNKMRPLVPVEGSEYQEAQDRYVPPTAAASAAAALAATGDEPTNVTSAADPRAAAEAAILAADPDTVNPALRHGDAPTGVPSEVPPAPPIAASIAASTPAPRPSTQETTGIAGTSALTPPPPPAAQVPSSAPQPGALPGQAGPSESADEGESWVTEPEAPGQVLPGSLSGTNEPPPAAGADTTPSPAPAAPATPTPAPAPAPAAAPSGDVAAAPSDGAPGQTPSAPAEEHAAASTGIPEETGAAQPPTGPPPEGEFAQAEEVGSPGAPAAHESTQIEE